MTNKWGYLNNPNWKNTPSGSENYTGDEANEPQVWPAPEVNIRHSDKVGHSPCGHWHDVETPETLPSDEVGPTGGGTPGAITGTITYGGGSMALLKTYSGTVNRLYVANPTTLRIIRAIGVPDVAQWITDYSETLSNTNKWIEPNICVMQFYDTFAVGLIRPYPSHSDEYGIQIIGRTIDGGDFYSVIYGGTTESWGSFFTVDGNNSWIQGGSGIPGYTKIYVVRHTYLGGTTYLYCFISSDRGLTFTPVLINSIASLTSTTYATWLYSFGADMILIVSSVDAMNGVYISTDHGATWVNPGVLTIDADASYRLSYGYYFAGTYLGAYCPVPLGDIKIVKSTDGVTWTTVHTIAGLQPYWTSCVFGYRKNIYYAAFNFRNASSGLSDGYTQIYTSPDGDTWTHAATINDDSELEVISVVGDYTPRRFYPSKLSEAILEMYYMFYKSVLQYGSDYYLTYWGAGSPGTTWHPVQTPFRDSTHS